MIVNLYVIFDKVAQEAGVPFDAKNDDIAIRKFEEVINKQIRPVKTVSVSDYDLLLVGSFDSETCILSPFEDGADHKLVCNGSEVKEWTVEQPTFDVNKLRELLASGPVEGTQMKPKKKHFWSK